MKPNVIFGGLDAEGYLFFGLGIHIGGFYDRTTKNYGAFWSFDFGVGIGASAGGSGGIASNLSSFQGPVSVIGGGVGPVSANYTSPSNSPGPPISVSVGPGVNAIPPLPVPASFHAGKSNTHLFATTLPPCKKT